MLELSYASVFAEQTDRPLIPIETIVESLDTLEGRASNAIAIDVSKGTDLLGKNGRDVLASGWAVGAQMQRHLSALWKAGYVLGGRHAWAEMRNAIEGEDQFDFDPQTLSLIAALLTGEPGLIIPLNIEQAIASRVLSIAGNYSKDVLAKIKGHITGAALGKLSLKEAITKELSIGRARAETIARNELTYAYNTARLQVFRQSALVTHVRFLSILDGRTTEICRSRNGMLIPIDQPIPLAQNRPPLHHRCRSMLSPIMPAVNSDHALWLEDPKRAWDGRDLEPLAEGWNV